MSDIDPEAIKPGDLIRLRGSDSDWRVYERAQQHETAFHSGLLIACGIKGSAGNGGWKPTRRITDHVPRSEESVEPDDGEQATLDVAADRGDLR